MNIVTESISRIKRKRERKKKKERGEERERDTFHHSVIRALIIRPLTGQIKLHLRRLTGALNLVSPVMMADGFRSAATSARIFRRRLNVKTSASMALFGDSARKRETNDARNREMRRPSFPPPFPSPRSPLVYSEPLGVARGRRASSMMIW